MAALVLDKCIFLHAPKTGGTWAMEVLRAQDLPVATLLAPDGSTHPTVAQVQAVGLDLPIISAVRAPVGWLRSFWRFFYARAWRQPAVPVPGFTPLLELAAPTFAQFAARYLQRRPGYVTELQRQYLAGAEYVCRQESLVSDLMAALLWCGQSYTPASFDLRQHPRVNVSQTFLAECPDSLLDELAAADAWILARYYPEIAHAPEPADPDV